MIIELKFCMLKFLSSICLKSIYHFFVKDFTFSHISLFFIKKYILHPLFIKYHAAKIESISSIIEITLLLGFAAAIGWNLDLAAIAGIIIVVGTGVDHQIVITDGVLSGKHSEEVYDWKKRIKNAFFIIMAAYFTTVFAMLPLWFAGAGLLKGFALTTIVGVSLGVLITRPAYAAVIEILMKD